VLGSPADEAVMSGPGVDHHLDWRVRNQPRRKGNENTKYSLGERALVSQSAEENPYKRSCPKQEPVKFETVLRFELSIRFGVKQAYFGKGDVLAFE
jgi:hypothetical protein